jgi:hypothetical protein
VLVEYLQRDIAFGIRDPQVVPGLAHHFPLVAGTTYRPARVARTMSPD